MLDVAWLAFLRPSSQENDELIAVLPEIDAIAGAKIDAILVDPATHTLHIREIPALKPGQGDGHFSGSFGVEATQTTRQTGSFRRKQGIPGQQSFDDGNICVTSVK
jgi:hypothetical protein